jgi:SAM-dependent methyltransferase
MDEIARHNKERWEDLARAGIGYSRPILDFTAETAREFLDDHDVMGDVAGKAVLCLAGGGGQQSAAFALLGAEVTVLDLCETQLDRDRQAAEHYGFHPDLQQGDMRDLSRFETNGFDMVYHAHSLSFIPDARIVFDHVARVLRPGGLYHLSYTNPFVHGMLAVKWNGTGYAVSHPYEDGREVTDDDPSWDVTDEQGNDKRIEGPREWLHTLSGVVNGLIERRLNVLGIWEGLFGKDSDAGAKQGSWAHFQAHFPPALVIWCRLDGE